MDSFDEPLLEPLISRSVSVGPDDVKTLRQRLYARIWRVFNEGVLGFLVGMFCLSLGVLFGRVALASYARYREDVGLEIRGVTARNEPRANEDRMGVLSAVLGPLSGIVNGDSLQADLLAQTSERAASHQPLGSAGSGEVLDGSSARGPDTRTRLSYDRRAKPRFQAECVRLRESAIREIERLQEAFCEMYALALEHRVKRLRGEASPSDEATLTEALTTLAQRYGRTIPTATWIDVARNRIKDFASGRVPVLRAEESTQWNSAVRAFGPLGTWRDPVFTRCATLVPSVNRFLFDAALSDPRSRPDQSEFPYTERERLSLITTSLLGPVTALFPTSLNAANSDSNSFAILQAFFVSPDNILALYRDTVPTMRFGEELPPTKLWSDANYFQAPLIGALKSYTSPAYIDFVDGGFVLTYSRAVRHDRVDPSSGSTYARDGFFAGVIAVDLQLPTTPLVDYLATNTQLLDVRKVRLHEAGDNVDLNAQVYRPEFGGLWKDNDLEWVLDVSESRHFEREIRSYRARPEFWSEILELESSNAGEFCYLLPLRDAEEHTKEALLVSFPTPTLPDGARWGAVLAITFTSLGVGLVLSGWRNCLKSSELRNKVWLMSNLQVGVLSLDEEDRIVEANDRAMEILGQLLPKAGAPPALQDLRPVTFGSFIHPTIYISPNETYRSSESPDPPRAEEFSDAIYAEYIRQERGRGVSSRYYARLKGADRAGRAWIRVWGTPILGRPNGAKGRRTFGIFERAIFWPELEKRFNADNRSKDVRNAPRASADAASEARSRGSDHRDAGAGKREQDGADPEATMWSARLSRGTER